MLSLVIERSTRTGPRRLPPLSRSGPEGAGGRDVRSKAGLKKWTAHWDDRVEFEIVPVRTSEEAARVMAPRL